MELKDFIKNSLVEIVNGVREAQEATKELGATVSPEINRRATTVSSENIRTVEFNVAVTTTDEAKAGAGIKVASILKVGGDVKEINSSVSTIRFEIPIVLPLCQELN
ncbi:MULTISPECIES: hypothetical protein [Marinifilum]|uniref:Uncharacterized protein n=1 Tax=Marinifilum flexuosum TaxID=1117708 RepID=A0A419X6R8_9BACT|nr:MULTISPECIES: hypothetical protein [Marinifilum]RKE03453.1 hypothetical protein BXY64_0458 [Marinifilum flexuosum]